jgi:flavin reductase (DIM6/NTAB) family NADH-FMN oxidoreductase RutF
MKMISAPELRKALGSFVTGVTVVTTVDASGEKRGFTANSFTSVSLDPPLILVCIAKGTSSFSAFAVAKTFAVNILAEEQKATSSAFASRGLDKFAGISWRLGSAGAPILDAVAAWIECELHQQVDAGDHLILIGRIVDLGHSDRTPLGFVAGNYVSFSLERKAGEATQDHVASVGGVFEKNGKVLFFVNNSGQFYLPTGRTLGEKSGEAGSLFYRLHKQGIEASVSFVYSINYEDGSSAVSIYYRGEISDGPPPDSSSAKLIALNEIPWNMLPSQNQKAMLQRYAKERAETRFGIYVGSVGGGTIRNLEPGI